MLVTEARGKQRVEEATQESYSALEVATLAAPTVRKSIFKPRYLYSVSVYFFCLSLRVEGSREWKRLHWKATQNFRSPQCEKLKEYNKHSTR